MSRLLGSLDLLLGILFGVLALAALSGVPTAFDRLAEESEDFYGLLFLFVASVAVGGAAALVGWVLVRRRFFWRISFDKAASLSAALSVVLVLVSLVGFWPDDPASRELRLLLLPAALLGASFFLLRRTHQQQDS